MKSRDKRPRKIRAVPPIEADESGGADHDEAAQAEAETDNVQPISHAAPAMTEQEIADAADEAQAQTEAAHESSDSGAEIAADGDAAAASAEESDSTHPEANGAESSEPTALPIDRTRLKAVLESLIFVSERTVNANQLARAAKIKAALARELIAELMLEYSTRGIELIEVAGGYQFRSAPACAAFVREFVAQKPVRLTSAQLETLALVAYRQPMTRPEIDDVRGVDSGSAIRVLLERNLIKMLGRKDEPGRPLLYGTSGYFLEFFGMRSLKDLPTLREFTDLSEESRALFKRKTGEAIEEAEASLLWEQDSSAAEEQSEHISDEDLAELAREADAEAEADPQEAAHSVPPDEADRATVDGMADA